MNPLSKPYSKLGFSLLLFCLVLGFGKTSAQDWVSRSGKNLVVGVDSRPFVFRGINLSFDRVQAGEWRMADTSDWGTPVTDWYQEKHFQTLANAGFNSLRLNLSYRIFEDNAAPGIWKQSGWDLLDTLVQWAKNQNIYLILDMHVAPGGAGIVSCMGCGWKTWDVPAMQDRFAALWFAIANRYANEPAIAAYDLLNEPAPTQSEDQWKALSQRLADTIRTVDSNHLLVLEMPNWIFDSSNQSPLSNYDLSLLSRFQFLINDSLVLYDYHFYLPGAFTLQDESGIPGGSWPDASIMEYTFSAVNMPRTRDYMRNEMNQLKVFWDSAGVPFQFGEWSPAASSFTATGVTGGKQYLQDFMELADSAGASWQYYFIHHLWQIDCCYGDNPTAEIDTAVTNVFRRQLSDPLPVKIGRSGIKSMDFEFLAPTLTEFSEELPERWKGKAFQVFDLRGRLLFEASKGHTFNRIPQRTSGVSLLRPPP